MTTTPTKLSPETKLERHVAKWLKEQGQDYDNGIEDAAKDLFQGGCQSGIVGHLCYYTDTVKFYKQHKKEIVGLLNDLVADTELSHGALFGDKWDKEDLLAEQTNNQNLLAWFGFEEAARALCDRAGIDI